MATRQWLRGGDVILPLGVLGAIVVVDALLPARIVVSGAFVIAAIVASAITTVRRTALIAAAATALATLSAVWTTTSARRNGGFAWLPRWASGPWQCSLPRSGSDENRRCGT